MKKKIRAGIIGGSGYIAGELIRLLIYHPNVQIQFIYSRSYAGKNVTEIHKDLLGLTEHVFTNKKDFESDIIFLCMGHKNSRIFLRENKIPAHVKIIDFSSDFRSKDNNYIGNRCFIYGLPELNRNVIRVADSIANPGCFATSIELSLLPLGFHIQDNIHVYSMTGSTGAGQDPSPYSHFSWRDNNISVYKVFDHQHLFEIKETLSKAYPDFCKEIHWVPLRGNFSRGIFSTIYAKSKLSESILIDLYRNYYSNHPFVIVTDSDIHLKQVVNTNNCIVSVRKKDDFVFLVCIIDNLLKGACGQAVQNMNLMFNIPETTGLMMKPVGF